MQDAMPGFHENDDEHLGMELVEYEDAPIAGPSKPRPRPPVSAPACSPPVKFDASNSDAANPKGKGKSRAKSLAPESGVAEQESSGPVLSMLECPICLKQLETDNQGLNAHIDWCLSKGAIWEAQAETVTPSSSASAKKGGTLRGKVKADKSKHEKAGKGLGKKSQTFNWGKSGKDLMGKG